MTRENKIPKEESPNNSWYEMKQAQIATWAWGFFYWQFNWQNSLFRSHMLLGIHYLWNKAENTFK